MNAPDPPDSKQFARRLLYHLTALRGEVFQNQLLLLEVLKRLPRAPGKDLIVKIEKCTEALIDEWYEEALREANLEIPEEGGPSLPKGRPPRRRG